MTDAPREDLIRMNGSFEVRAAAEGDGRTLHGYAAMFNEDTEIHSWEGDFIERIAPGAFKRSLKNNGDQVKILFNHGMDPQIGDKPLGRATVMKEDKTGLYVEVPLSRTSYNEDIIALLEDRALDGMSFRFSVIKDTWEEPAKRNGLPIRTLNEVRLMELGPVTFPAYQATTAGVRSRETLDAWQSLDDEARQQIAHILGTSFEARGSDLEELAGSNADDSDAVAAAHHSARTRYLQWQARQRLA
jgi:HK97 family phage prohead protease